MSFKADKFEINKNLNQSLQRTFKADKLKGWQVLQQTSAEAPKFNSRQFQEQTSSKAGRF